MHEALDTVIMVDDQDELDEIELQSRELEDTIGSSSSLHGAARALLAVEEDGGGGSSTSVLSCGIGPSSSCRDLSTSSSRGQVDELGLALCGEAAVLDVRQGLAELEVLLLLGARLDSEQVVVSK